MKKDLITGLAWGGGIVAVALGMSYARKLGYVDSETVTRVVIGLNGLMIAWYGNLMPKKFYPAALARQVARIGGWSQVLSGLIYAALWAFAPMTVAAWVGSAVVLLGIAVPIGYCLLHAKTKVKTSA